ncbi:MAG TPA: response regulator [Tepidisphaeraceae bacterium]|jgi:two-component system chemotaxis response regulator CheY|nr:response regulator [Tepidisphaeraceae bacterium]
MPGKILIVDDSAITRALIKRAILLANLPVAGLLEAGNGSQALDVIRREQVDVLIADLNMPEMGGVELTRIILGDPLTKHIPVVIVSADPNPSRAAELLAAGVKGYVHKPFTPEVIRDTLSPLMGEIHV